MGVRISWECYHLYSRDEDTKRAAALRSAHLKHSSLPTVRKIKEYISEILAKIQLDSNIMIEDLHLMDALDNLQKEEGTYFLKNKKLLKIFVKKSLKKSKSNLP